MVKISVGGYDDGEGPSNPTHNHKRRRVEEEQEQEDQPQQQGLQIQEPPRVTLTQQEQDQEQQQQQQQDNDGTQEPAPAEDGNVHEAVGSNPERAHINGSASDERERSSFSVTLTDPDVLDCCICYEPLSAPIFQCENGHIACSRCCDRLGNKCPMCSMPIGYNRCRAIEKVVESIKIQCPYAKYGCKEIFSYCKKNAHEKECFYFPCSCPHPACDFYASSKELSLHFSHRHVGYGLQFTYDKFFSVSLNVDHKAIVLQEKNDGNLFIVHNDLETLGNIIHLTCIGPQSKAALHYDILARSQGSCLILQSVTKIIQCRISSAPSTGFLLIPGDFFGSGQLKLDIRIRLQN